MNPSGGHVLLYRDKDGDWRWTRVAGNGRKIADSGEGYRRRIDCADQVTKQYPGVPVRTLTTPTGPAPDC